MDLTGKGAVVTGGNSGIGKACALALSRAGAGVAITYHGDAEEAEEIVSAIRACGGKALACKADVGREEDVEALFAAAEAELGPGSAGQLGGHEHERRADQGHDARLVRQRAARRSRRPVPMLPAFRARA